MKDFLFTRPFVVLFLQNFLFFCSLNILNILSGYLEQAGASKTYIGLFMNLNSLALVFFVLFLTHWTQKTGRKKVLMAGYLVSWLGYPLMFLFYDQLGWLLAFRLLGTLSFCASFTILAVEAFALIPKEKRMAGIAIFGIGGLLSNPVSAWAGENAARLWGPRWVFVAALGFALLAGILALFHKYQKDEAAENPVGLLKVVQRPELRALVLLTLVFGGAFAVFSTFLSNLTLARFGQAIITPYFTAFSMTAIAGRFVFSQHLDRVPRQVLVAGALALIALAFGQALLLQSPWMLLTMGMAYGLGHSLLFPVLSTLYVNSGPEGDRFILNNTFSAVNTLGNVLLATALGALGDWLGLTGIFGVMGGLVAVGAVYAFAALKKPDRA